MSGIVIVKLPDSRLHCDVQMIIYMHRFIDVIIDRVVTVLTSVPSAHATCRNLRFSYVTQNTVGFELGSVQRT
jgi:hypothetical protein